jgi:hypothetical protein
MISLQSGRRSLNIHIDHSVSVIPYIVDPSCESMNQLWRGDAATWETATQQWEKDGSGLLGTR